VLDTHKTRMIGLSCSEETMTPERDEQTDRQNCYIKIVCKCAEAQ